MPPRVVSLVPSVTETLLAWDVVPMACTRFCEQPDLLHVGGTKDPDVEAIIGLRPDLVVVDEEENRKEDADALAAAGLDLHVTAIRSLTDVMEELPRLAGRVGHRYSAVTVAPRLAAPAIRVFVPIWRRPWMTIGGDTYGSTLLAAAGAANVFAGSVDRYPETALDDAAALAPDAVLGPSEPYPFAERHRAELERVAPLALVDGKDLFWWGVRSLPALERLGALVEQLAAG